MRDTFQVFVYGTLKPGEGNFGPFCASYVREQQVAIAPGRIYHLPGLGYPAMTLEPGWVQGVLFTFDPTDATVVLHQLDGLEDYYPDRPEASAYERIRHPVYTPEAVPLAEAWVYVMTRQQVDALGGQWLSAGCWSGRQWADFG